MASKAKIKELRKGHCWIARISPRQMTRAMRRNNPCLSG